MRLKDFKLQKGNHFIAMEYYGLILNRTFLIILYSDSLIALKVNGIVSVQTHGDPITNTLTGTMAINGDLNNPYSYIKSKYLRKLEAFDITGQEILNVSKSNFKISKADIHKVRQTNKKKWGMGPYIHDGRVFIKTKDQGEREFIILGNQSSKDIAGWLIEK